MNFLLRLLLIVLTVHLSAEKIETFYGSIDVEEPILLELIHSAPMQRLKKVHQYGVAYYTTHREEYNRFEHSLGVFTVLRLKGAALEEQISGLLHDVSHTVFSHVGDWVFNKQCRDDDYQSIIFRFYLLASGLEKILNKHGYTIEQVIPSKQRFAMLEQPLPNLCADRIDYNLQGAYYQNFITKDEALEFLQDLRFAGGHWLTTRVDIAAKLTRFSLFMTEDCWSSPINHMQSKWLAEAIWHGFSIGLISWEEFHFGVDDNVWEKLCASKDTLVQDRMQKIHRPQDFCRCVEPAFADELVKFKSRGIDPWILKDGNTARLTAMNAELAEAFEKVKLKAAHGWPIQQYVNEFE